QGGLGIGLTRVRSLVEMHDGTVEAHSPGLGQGSELVVRLPLAPPQACAEGPRAATADGTDSAPPPAGTRILVVDDNRDAADSLATLLRRMGHDVQRAYDGLEAAQAAATFQPGVVLTDIGLPKLNGYEV